MASPVFSAIIKHKFSKLSGKIVDLDLNEALNNKDLNYADDKEVEQFINSI